ncbi:hypothetical protein I317_01014 [Kwoniella heveanensis CBS 569]|nr:hypothetical protein I317_01014 [Kwoniella heveanensis CBS 569]
MPRVPKSTSPPVKPYDRSATPTSESADHIKPKMKPASTPNSPTKTGRRWTSEELTQLFEHVSKHGTGMGTSGWAQAVPDRTANQAYQIWLQSLGPFLKKAIAAKK